MDLKVNGNVAFKEDGHKYFDLRDPKKEYISVTTLIGKFEQQFDKDFWSKYKALEKVLGTQKFSLEKPKLLKTKVWDPELLSLYDISENDFNSAQQDILDEWDKTNREACERGTRIHSIMENKFYSGAKSYSLKSYGIGGKFECKKDYTKLDLEKGVYPEYLVHICDDNVRLAGQIDLLIKDGNDITIGDYKGLPLETKIPTITGWSTIAELKVGDTIFDKNGNPTKIKHKSKVHLNPCYKITFDNGDTIIADHEHRWEISFKRQTTKNNNSKYSQTVMTTEEICEWLKDIESLKTKNTYTIPKILNPKPLNLPDVELPIDPYVLGAWLGDGSKSCGIITQAKDSPLWDEIKRRGFEIGENAQHNPDRENVEMRTVYGLKTLLNTLGLKNKKFIPDIYQRASYNQRLDLLRGLMDTDGYYNPGRKRYVMSTGQEWQKDDMVKLLSSLGVKVTTFELVKKCNDKQFKAWDVCFSTSEFNPFLIRNQDIDLNASTVDKRTFRNIISVEPIDTVPTQCLEVDSETHTFLCTEKMIVTHNTNGSIDKKSSYNTFSKKYSMMKYPLNNLMDCNFYHYSMQLSTYAWMLKYNNPEFNIKRLFLLHFPHDKKDPVIYEVEYLEDEVKRMINEYKKILKREERELKRKPIDF